MFEEPLRFAWQGRYAVVPFQAADVLDMSEFDEPIANYFRPHFHSVSIVAAPPGWRVLVTDALGAPFLALEQWVERIEDVFAVAEYLTAQELHWWSRLGRPFDPAQFVANGGRPQPRPKPIPQGKLGDFEKKITEGHRRLQKRLEGLVNEPLSDLPEGVPEIRGLPVVEAERVLKAAGLFLRCLDVPLPAGGPVGVWVSNFCPTRVNAHALNGIVVEVLGRS